MRQREKNASHLQLMEQLKPFYSKHLSYMRHKREINKLKAKLALLSSLEQSTKESSTITTTVNTPQPTIISMSSNESVSTGITTVNSTTNLSPTSSSKTCGQNCNCAFKLSRSPFESLFSNDNNNDECSNKNDQTIGSVSCESTTKYGNTATSSLDSIRRQIHFESYMNTSFESMNRIIDSTCSTRNGMNEELVNNNQNSGSHRYNLRSTNQSHSNNNNSNNNASSASNSSNINNVSHNDNCSVNSNDNTDVEDKDNDNDNDNSDTDDQDDNSNGGFSKHCFLFNTIIQSMVSILFDFITDF